MGCCCSDEPAHPHQATALMLKSERKTAVADKEAQGGATLRSLLGRKVTVGVQPAGTAAAFAADKKKDMKEDSSSTDRGFLFKRLGDAQPAKMPATADKSGEKHTMMSLLKRSLSATTDAKDEKSDVSLSLRNFSATAAAATAQPAATWSSSVHSDHIPQGMSGVGHPHDWASPVPPLFGHQGATTKATAAHEFPPTVHHHSPGSVHHPALEGFVTFDDVMRAGNAATQKTAVKCVSLQRTRTP